MTNFPVIGICGAARSGKDTVADYLVRECNFYRVSFADPIYDMVCALMGVDHAWIERNKSVCQPVFGMKTPRILLQTLGTEWGREIITPEIWVDMAFYKIAEHRNDHECKGIVLPDLRFNNEAQAIHDYGGTIWEIIRENQEFIDEADHASEAGIDIKHINITIENDGKDLKGLYSTVDYLRREFT